MIRLNHLKADFKQMARDPILLLFMGIPLFSFVVFKLLILFLVPEIKNWTGFDLSPWYSYVLVMAFGLSPEILGSATGFLMIDNRDENIYQLMSVTPMGYSGYMANRLLIPFTASALYTFIGYALLPIYPIDSLKLVFISLLSGMEGIIVSLLLFQFAEDKVQGLTYAKALGVITLFGLADLLGEKWVSAIAGLVPFYWPSRLIRYPATLPTAVLSIAVHILWIALLLMRHKKKL